MEHVTLFDIMAIQYRFSAFVNRKFIYILLYIFRDVLICSHILLLVLIHKFSFMFLFNIYSGKLFAPQILSFFPILHILQLYLPNFKILFGRRQLILAADSAGFHNIADGQQHH